MCPQIGIMAGVTGLYRVQALSLQPLNDRPSSPILQMGHRNRPARSMHNTGHSGECRQSLFHERRAPATQKTIERIVEAGSPSVAYNGPSDVRPADGPAPGLVEHGLEWKIDTEPLELIHHFPGPSQPVGPAPLEKGLQLG
jgi:hypothetical protein